jgi:hypothetical protein
MSVIKEGKNIIKGKISIMINAKKKINKKRSSTTKEGDRD